MHLGRHAGILDRAALNSAIAEIEVASGNAMLPTGTALTVDAIFVMDIAADHLHQSSLQLTAATQLFAIQSAAKTITFEQHFNSVGKLSDCDPSKTAWKDAHPGLPLPPQ
ncbi:hypothetical protein B0I35DRAFT_179524 [Stachybotrys elegans]|uniref:Uncharacterized protein n=1 Tax=Stachybotrys elegans TaxID=80388 RepID=A0A8K0WIQ1_9HYPO|nr:hypothetical protein B0I35DRAFT_179524 [Stachybotrys elegans]